MLLQSRSYQHYESRVCFQNENVFHVFFVVVLVSCVLDILA